MRKVSFRVPDELYDEVVKFADANGSGFSDVIRLALINFVTTEMAEHRVDTDVTRPTLFRLLGLTQAIAEQLGLSSIRRADQIAASLASEHHITSSELQMLNGLLKGDHK